MKIHNINNLTYNSFRKNKVLLEELFEDSNINFKKLIDIDVKLLSKESAEDLWIYLYGSFYDKKTRWFPEEDHWMNFAECEKTGIIWMKDNIEMPFEMVKRDLKNKFMYEEDSKIFFFETEYEIIECSWKIFTTYWKDFISYNNESKIWCYASKEILQIRPYGDIVKFKRELSCPTVHNLQTTNR